MHDFRRLQVWQRAREFARDVDTVVRGFPRRDNGVIARQLRRAALPIPANIAEGCGKSSHRETIRYLQIASGSAMEAENHLVIASDVGFLHPKAYHQLADRARSIQRMLAGLMERLPERSVHPGS